MSSTNYHTPSINIQVDYSKQLDIITDRQNATAIAELLTYLFTNTIKNLSLTKKEGSIDLTIEKHGITYQRLSSQNTLLYTPSKVALTIFSDGRIEFKDRDSAPYEQVDLCSYLIWNKATFINETFHINSTLTLSCYFKIADLGSNIKTLIPYRSIASQVDQSMV